MTLAQVHPAPPLERLHGIRDRLAEGSTFTDLALLLGVVATAVVVIFAVLGYLQRRRNRLFHHPGKLFTELLRRLPLSAAQRDLLRRIARDLRLEQPAVLVLSPQVYRNHANRWMSLTRQANRETQQRLAGLSDALFPGPDPAPAPLRAD